MVRATRNRYSSVAVSLHWLIAIVILGLVIIAKVAHSLEKDDPLRFDLIQWHKSFGIAVLLLVAFRVLWRFTHKPPSLPAHMGTLERIAASLGHIGLYCLMFALPLSGWALVSSSPLNLATELFGLIPWPHIPWLETISDKDVWEYRFSSTHYWLGNALIALVAVHVLAALRHHFWLRDGLLTRMTIAAGDQRSGLFFGVLVGIAGLLALSGLTERQLPVVDAVAVKSAQHSEVVGSSQIGFSASQLGDPLNGVFTEHDISLQLDTDSLDQAKLEAMVVTGSVSTGDGQIDATLVTAEWFGADQYPQANFESSRIIKTPNDVFEVTGLLTIRDVAKEVTFPMLHSDDTYRGDLVIDRRDFGVGVGGQDEFVAPEVTISFSFNQ